MENGANQDKLIAYAAKLAEVQDRIRRMSPEERQKYAAKVSEIEARIAQLPPEVRALYEEKLADLAQPQQPTAAPRQPSPAPAPRPARPAPRPAAKPAPRPEVPVEEEDDDGEAFEEDAPAPGHGRKKKRHGCLIVAIVLVVALLAALFLGFSWVMDELNGSRGNNIVRTQVVVEQGSGPLTIGQLLEEEGIIRSGQVFRLYVRQKGVAPTLQYGSFDLASDMSYDEIITALQQLNQDRDTVTVTFPEGIPAVEFGTRLEAAGLCTAEAFLESANEDDFSDLNFWSKRDENPNQFMACEGYLFPDTYEFFKDEDVHNIVRKLYAEFDSKMTEEMYQQIDGMGMTLSQFMTLASIVQEEAGGVEHQADVAAIFMNRLAEDSPVTLLQSNCSSYIQNENDNNYLYNTVAWYYGDWSLIPQEIITAYDTYTTPGLPAGPISNPGLDAIQNTLRYAESEYYGNGYYFFVTDTDGNYYFNQTANAHEAKCAELRANGKMAG